MQFLAMSAIATGTAVVNSVSYAQAVQVETPQSKTVASTAEETQMIVRPKLPIELAINLKYIFDHNLLLRDDFYMRENMQNFFNVGDASVVTEGGDISITMSDFSKISPQKNMPGDSFSSTPRAQLTGGKISPNSTAAVIAAINFSMNLGGPNFDQTVRIFGKNFERPFPVFSPHMVPTPPTAPHGNESLEYEKSEGATRKFIDLGFNPSGELSNIVIRYEKINKDIK